MDEKNITLREAAADEPQSFSMKVKADGDEVVVSFSGFQKGSTVFKALLMLTSEEYFAALANQFFAIGDMSMLEFAQDTEVIQ